MSVLDESIDLTIPGKTINEGALHPITQMKHDLNDAFLSLGFEVYSEDDISSEKYAFDNLNFAKNHPAREKFIQGNLRLVLSVIQRFTRTWRKYG